MYYCVYYYFLDDHEQRIYAYELEADNDTDAFIKTSEDIGGRIIVHVYTDNKIRRWTDDRLEQYMFAAEYRDTWHSIANTRQDFTNTLFLVKEGRIKFSLKYNQFKFQGKYAKRRSILDFKTS